MAGRSVVDRETRSSILPVRTRYRLSSVAERGPPKPDVDCSIQSAGANFLLVLSRPTRRYAARRGCGASALLRSNAGVLDDPAPPVNLSLEECFERRGCGSLFFDRRHAEFGEAVDQRRVLQLLL